MTFNGAEIELVLAALDTRAELSRQRASECKSDESAMLFLSEADRCDALWCKISYRNLK